MNRTIFVETNVIQPKLEGANTVVDVQTQQVLENLARCDGIEKYTVLMFIEPVDDEVARVARNFDAAARTVVHINPVVMGFPHNLRQAVEVGFTQVG